LTEKGVEFEAINFFEQPLTADLLKQLLHSAGLKPSEALRTNDSVYKERVAGKDLIDEELIRLMVKHPELIQRPLVVKGKNRCLLTPVIRVMVPASLATRGSPAFPGASAETTSPSS
jgi:arsenate reductase